MLFAGLPFGNNVQIGLATSTDGVNWTAYSGDPVISNADSQAWASFREFPAALIYANGAYKTWLKGDNSDLDTDPGYGTGFGLATSPHAVNWTMSAANPIRWELNVPNGTSLDLVGVVALNGRYDAYYLSNTPAGAVVETAASVNGATFSGDQPVVAPPGYTMLAATTTTVDNHAIVFSVWQNGGVDYYATSRDGLHFTIDGQIGLPADFSTNSLAIVDGNIDFYGGVGVGNVNWAYGNTVIEYATAPFPSIAVPELCSWAMLLLGFGGLAAVTTMRRKRDTLKSPT
jgi:hypothetical protein